MEKLQIKNYNIICSKTDMNIINSYDTFNIKLMEEILNEALTKTKVYKTDRKMNSLTNE